MVPSRFSSHFPLLDLLQNPWVGSNSRRLVRAIKEMLLMGIRLATGFDCQERLFRLP